MLIDDIMPEYHFAERHQRVVPAPSAAVREAAESWRPADSFAARWLFRLRGLGRPHGTLREWAEGLGFLHLAETDDEIVYGQIGRFWAWNERGALVSPRSLEAFRRFDDARYAVAVINVHVARLTPNETLLSTETRVRAGGPSARRRFRLYWLLIRPFSGLLRREMLRLIGRRAVGYQPSTPTQDSAS